MLDGTAEYSSTSECNFSEFHFPTSKKKRSSKNNKPRFSDAQIRSLEVMFESETKLEHRKKLQLAKELGLQPRQVAIWFQNKRARWKSKQIEKDYNVLLSNYNNLASQFESLKKEKQSLLVQLQKLKNETVGNPEGEKQSKIQETASNSRSCDGESVYEKAGLEMKNVAAAKNSFEGMLSDDDSSMKAEFLGLDEENELLKMVEHAAADSSLTSADNQDWGSLDSVDLIINQPADQNYQWWDFWP